MRRLAVAAFAGLMVAAVPVAQAQRGSDGRFGDYRQDAWVELDQQRLERGSGRVVLPVGRQEGRHTAIRIKILDEQVFVENVLVTYGNGTTTEIPIRRMLREGDVTPPIDLEGDRRFIRDVTMFVRQDPRFRGARVSLLGDVVEGRGRPERRPPPPPVEQFRDIPRGWVLFGSQRANFDGDRDFIQVGRDRGRFDKIALKVRDNDVFIRDVLVRYSDGGTQDFVVNSVIRADYRTPEFRLDKPHGIESIEITYRTEGRGRTQSTVEFYGELANNSIGDGGRRDRERDNDGWLLIGAKAASMVRSDNDNFDIDNRIGRVTKIRLRVRNSPVRINQITLGYASGATQTFAVNRMLNPGEWSPPLELERRSGYTGRQIRSVTIGHKTPFSLKGEGVVEVYAHQ